MKIQSKRLFVMALVAGLALVFAPGCDDKKEGDAKAPAAAKAEGGDKKADDKKADDAGSAACAKAATCCMDTALASLPANAPKAAADQVKAAAEKQCSAYKAMKDDSQCKAAIDAMAKAPTAAASCK